MNFVTINQNERKKELKRQEDIYLFKTYFDFDNPDMETNWKLLKNNQESIYKINRLLNTLARYTRENERKRTTRTFRRSPTSPINFRLLSQFKIEHLLDTKITFPNMGKIKLLKQLLQHSKKQYLSPLSEFVYYTPDTNTSPTRKIKKRRRKRFRRTYKGENFRKRVTAMNADRLHPEKSGGRRRRRKSRKKRKKTRRRK